MEIKCVITGYSTWIIEKENIDKEYSKYFNWEKSRRINLDSKLIQLTVLNALDMSAVDFKKIDKSRIGIVFGTAFGSLESYEEFYGSLTTNIQPNAFSNSLANIPASVISIFYGITGPSITLSDNFLAGIDALILGREMICDGLCDVVIVGAWYLQSTSSKKLVSSPYSGGAGIIIMESLGYTEKRSANILTGIKGFAKKMIDMGDSATDKGIDYVILYKSSHFNSFKLPCLKIKEEIPGISSFLSVVEGIKKIQENNDIKNVMINIMSNKFVSIFLEKNSRYGTSA